MKVGLKSFEVLKIELHLVLLPAPFVNTILFESIAVSTKRNSLVGEKFIEFKG